MGPESPVLRSWKEQPGVPSSGGMAKQREKLGAEFLQIGDVVYAYDKLKESLAVVVSSACEDLLYSSA